MSARTARRLWAIVPAAGRGERFASTASPGIPKQYTPLLGRSVLEWSLRALLAEPRIQGIVVVLAAGDAHWAEIARSLDSPKLLTWVGGAHRQDAVMNGLEYLAPTAQADDWILVHDAARPCLRAGDLSAFCDALENNPRSAAADIGGVVLAAPIVDTIKRELPHGLETVDRTGLWRALTPQVFAYAALRKALNDAAADKLAVTDEAQAMERMGIRAALVPGSPFNIKVTRAEDLEVAAGLLKRGERTQRHTGQGGADTPSARGIPSCLGACASPMHRASARTRTAMSSFTPYATRCWAPWEMATSASIFPTATRATAAPTAECFCASSRSA